MSIAISFRSCKIKWAPSGTGPAPGERLASYLVTSDPVKRLFLYIGVVSIFNKKMCVIFSITSRLADQRIFLFFVQRYPAPVPKLPWRQISRGVIFDMFYVSPSFQYKCFHPLFTKFLCGPSSAYTTPNYDGIVSVL